jgi:hypothetical protein
MIEFLEGVLFREQVYQETLTTKCWFSQETLTRTLLFHTKLNMCYAVEYSSLFASACSPIVTYLALCVLRFC